MRAVFARSFITFALLTSQTAWATVFEDYEVIDTLATDANPRSVTSADFDTDSNFDLAVTNQNDNQIAVFLGQGNANFRTAATYTTGTAPYSVTSADVNNVGGSDLITANRDSDNISVFINNGNGTFATKVDYPTATAPVYVVAAELTATDTDLVVANSSSNSISVLINNGDGTFAAKVDYPTGTSPNAIAAADVDGDADIDLAVVNLGSDTVSIFLNNGNGTFAAKVDYATGTEPFSVASSDLNGDTFPDLAISNSGNATISILMNNLNGTFATKVDHTAGTTPHTIAIGDLDNDSDLDIAVTNNASDTVSVFTNQGVGNLSTKADFSSLKGPSGLFIQDINNDTYSDLIITNLLSNNFSYLNNLTRVTPDTDNFSFTPQTGVALATTITSETITIEGLEKNVVAPISISAKAQFAPDSNSVLYNAAYSVNGGTFTSEPGTVVGPDLTDGDDKNDVLTVTVQLTSSSRFDTTVETTLTIGGASATFSVTTRGDTTPNTITIIPKVDIELNTATISEPVTITGLGGATTIGIAGGEYRINGGSFTSTPGNLFNNDVLEIRVTSASTYGSRRETILSIGGVQTSFVVITKDNPSGSTSGTGNLSIWMTLFLICLLLYRRRSTHANQAI